MNNNENLWLEDVLRNHIGEWVVVSYNYTGGVEDDSVGYDSGIIIEVGNGYIILNTAENKEYLHKKAIVNLANVTSIYMDKK